LADVKKELLGYLTQAKTSGQQIAVETAQRLELWLIQLGTGEIGQRDFKRLVEAARLKIQQWENTQKVEALAAMQRIMLKAIDLALSKIAPLLG
jgi:hypothetical protein